MGRAEKRKNKKYEKLVLFSVLISLASLLVPVALLLKLMN